MTEDETATIDWGNNVRPNEEFCAATDAKEDVALIREDDTESARDDVAIAAKEYDVAVVFNVTIVG